jgi:hypothetical protein
LLIGPSGRCSKAVDTVKAVKEHADVRDKLIIRLMKRWGATIYHFARLVDKSNFVTITDGRAAGVHIDCYNNAINGCRIGYLEGSLIK